MQDDELDGSSGDAPAEPETVGRRLRDARRAVGLTQQEVADKIGVTRRAVYEWEGDQRLPHSSLPALAKLYGVPAMRLLHGVDPVSEQLRADVELMKARLDDVHRSMEEVTALLAELAALVRERLRHEDF